MTRQTSLHEDFIGPVPPTAPGVLDRAARVICRHGIDPDDVELLLDMCGLREAA